MIVHLQSKQRISMAENTTEQIKKLLSGIIHPETGKDIVSLGIVDDIAADASKINITLRFAKSRDPFAMSIKRKAYDAVSAAFPTITEINIFIKEQAKAVVAEDKPSRRLEGVRRMIAVASGKGGVGKSTVTSNLAVALAAEGLRVGVLDADIYGPSIPKMFGVEGFQPAAIDTDGREFMTPAESRGIEIMSIGFFINPTDALVWRGPMATNALRQMIRQTAWGELDVLLIDMPPGTGDIHLSIVQDLELDGAVIVSTPQQVAVADVRRGVQMFRAKGVDVPVLGVIENMAWFTPEELPDNRYYLFGRGGVRRFADEEKLPFLGEIPIIQSVMEGGDNGVPASAIDERVAKYYKAVAEKLLTSAQ